MFDSAPVFNPLLEFQEVDHVRKIQLKLDGNTFGGLPIQNQKKKRQQAGSVRRHRRTVHRDSKSDG